MKLISPDNLIAIDESENIRIHLAYAHDKPPNIFGKIYRKDARLWLHKDMAALVMRAAELAIQEDYGLLLFDGLRTIEAQEKMQASPIVQANPQWLEEPDRLLSPPGAGAHPRGMAIDVTLTHKDGHELPMGTDFDFLATDSSAAQNPAHRNHPHLSDDVKENRATLNNFMMRAAIDCEQDLLLLPQEWWDFRFPAETYEAYAPLSDADLPPEMRMTQT